MVIYHLNRLLGAMTTPPVRTWEASQADLSYGSDSLASPVWSREAKPSQDAHSASVPYDGPMKSPPMASIARMYRLEPLKGPFAP